MVVREGGVGPFWVVLEYGNEGSLSITYFGD